MRKFLSSLFLILFIFLIASPAAAQSATPPPTPGATAGPTYIVQPGDTLSSIAARFNILVGDLMAANGITDANLLSAGQPLVIPGLEGVTGVLDTAVINFGDSYRSLLRRTQVPEDLFRKLNRLISPTEFYVGASMIVPQSESAPKMTGSTPAKGESLLEMAVRDNSDPWTVAGLNGLAGTWDGLPGDVLYTPGGDAAAPVTGLPPVFQNAQIKGLPLRQGGTAVVQVRTAPGVTLGGLMVDHALHFFAMPDGTQVALQGVHALLEPGVYPLRIDATLPDGSQQSFEQLIQIVSGNYNSEVIPLNDPSTIDPAVTEPEMQQLETMTLPATPDRFWNGIFTPPAVYPDCFTSYYGTRRTYTVINSTTEVPGFHSGLDFCGGEGLAITAPAAGRVIFSGPLIVRGNATVIDHGWGVYSGFWHQSQFNVRVGDIVQQGQIIGLVGGTGRVTGAHLHWEVWVNGIQVNPLDWLSQEYP